MPFLDIFSKKKEKKEEKKIKIIVDNRERNSLVASYLMEQGFEIEFKQLPVGDYLIGNTAIERKTVSDFKSSIINKRIFTQLTELKQFESCLLIVEGILDEDLYNIGMHENAFRGFLLSVVLEYNVPVIYTHDEKDTAKYFAVLANKKEKGEQGIRASKIFLSKEEQVQFILEGFPNVGPAKARALIEKFGTLSRIFNASEEELEVVLGVRAKEFKEMLEFGK